MTEVQQTVYAAKFQHFFGEKGPSILWLLKATHLRLTRLCSAAKPNRPPIAVYSASPPRPWYALAPAPAIAGCRKASGLRFGKKKQRGRAAPGREWSEVRRGSPGA